jgi:hypothetical protein
MAWQIAEGLLPGILVFALLMMDPAPPEAAKWIAKAYSPMLLYALIRKIDVDSRILGIAFRTKPMPLRLIDLATQVALIAMIATFAIWPFAS